LLFGSTRISAVFWHTHIVEIWSQINFHSILSGAYVVSVTLLVLTAATAACVLYDTHLTNRFPAVRVTGESLKNCLGN